MLRNRLYLTRPQLCSSVMRLHRSRTGNVSLDRQAEPVSFMTNEDGEDLIVSFAVEDAAPGEVLSVILMRTPKFEHFLDPGERGVHVSHERYPDSDNELLHRIAFRGNAVEVRSTRRTYLLDVSRVDAAELKSARRILKRMNSDHSFELDLG